MTQDVEEQPAPTAADPHRDKREFIQKYWDALTTGDLEAFEPLVHEDCVVHYPGNHFLSGDHRGKKAIVDLYTKLYRIGIEPGTFIGQLHDVVTSDDHVCALVTYTLELGMGRTLTGQAVGVFHLQDGQMIEYWLLERDQKMINDIFKISGQATLDGSGNRGLAKGALRNPGSIVRTLRRVVREQRGTSTKML